MVATTPLLSRLCELATELVTLTKAGLAKRLPTTDAGGASLYWFAKAAKTYEAALRLWELGYWQDAATLARTMFDVFLQLAYLATDPDRLGKKFWADPTPRWSKMLKDIVVHGTPDDETRAGFAEYLKRTDLSEDEIRRVESWWVDEMASENAEASKGPDGKWRSLAKAVGSERAYVTHYPLLSFLVHGSPPAWRYFLFLDPEGAPVVDWTANEPRPELRAEAELMFSAAPVFMADIIRAVDAIWTIDPPARMQDFEKLLKAYNQQTS